MFVWIVIITYELEQDIGLPIYLMKINTTKFPLILKQKTGFLLKTLRNTRIEEKEALICAHGKLNSMEVVIAVFEFRFMGGSMGSVVGQKFVDAVNKAIELKAPFICFSTSGGARMQESLFSLFQMARTSAVLNKLKEEKLPYISFMTDPIYGGVSASLAMLGDINIAEPKAQVGFAGPRVIEDTVRVKLPEGFQRSEFLLEHGLIDMIVHRSEIKDKLYNLLSKLSAN